jgi:hypothetical protein
MKTWFHKMHHLCGSRVAGLTLYSWPVRVLAPADGCLSAAHSSRLSVAAVGLAPSLRRASLADSRTVRARSAFGQCLLLLPPGGSF